MKTFFTAPLLTAIIFCCILSCKKNGSSGNGSAIDWFSFKDKYLNTPQNFTTPDVAAPFSITLSNGTTIDFPANAFADFYNTSQLITGNVDLLINREVLSRKDIVLQSLLVGPVQNQQWIIGGETEIHASQNGNAIKINPAIAGNIVVTMPSLTNAGNNLNVMYTDPTFTWVSGGAANGNSTYNYNIETLLSNGLLTNYSCAKSDAVADAGITVTVNYEPGYNPNPPVNDQVTFVKVIYDNVPSATWLTTTTDYKSYTGKVSNNRSATIVVYSGGPGTPLYFGTLPVTLQNGQVYSIDAKQITEANLDVILNSL